MSINSTQGEIQLNFAWGLTVIILRREDLIFISLYSISRVDVMQPLCCKSVWIQSEGSGTFVVDVNYASVH